MASSSASQRPQADDKAQELLGRIAGTFARKGLDGASMQDLAAAAGMSVGNFYRYYPSKIALITALVDQCATDVERDFAAARSASDPFEAMRQLLQASLCELTDDEAALWLQIDAAAVIHPEIAAVKRTMDAAIRQNVVSMLSSVAGGDPARQRRVEEVADLTLLICTGLFRQRAFDDVDAFRSKADRITRDMFDWITRELRASSPACDDLLVVA